MTTAGDDQLERTILELLEKRREGATICPSDAARAAGDAEWRSLMQPARDAAQRLVEAGRIEVTQGGDVVDLRTAPGPIRLRLR